MNALTTRVENIMNTLPENFQELPEEQLRQVILAVKVDEYKQQAVSHIQKGKFNLEEKINIWLEGKAENSKRAYRLHLNNFLKYLNGNSVLDVTPIIVDEYIYNDLSMCSVGKARLALASLSSFYSILTRHELLIRNPFQGAKLKSRAVTQHTKKVIPSEDEINVIKSSYNTNTVAGKKMLLAIHIMNTYGLRVGFFNDALRYDGSVLSSISKGKYYEVNVEGDEFISDNKDLLIELNRNTIQASFNNMTKKLYENREVRDSYSPHSLRHSFACRLYMESRDIYYVSQMLHHTSVVVTQEYLRGLEVL